MEMEKNSKFKKKVMEMEKMFKKKKVMEMEIKKNEKKLKLK
jgi:hypothetical protein